MNQPPVAAFTFSTDEFTVDFTDQSSDPDGTIVSRELPARAFVVEAPAEWADSLRRIDLDERGEKSKSPHPTPVSLRLSSRRRRRDSMSYA